MLVFFRNIYAIACSRICIGASPCHLSIPPWRVSPSSSAADSPCRVSRRRSPSRSLLRGHPLFYCFLPYATLKGFALRVIFCRTANADEHFLCIHSPRSPFARVSLNVRSLESPRLPSFSSIFWCCMCVLLGRQADYHPHSSMPTSWACTFPSFRLDARFLPCQCTHDQRPGAVITFGKVRRRSFISPSPASLHGYAFRN
ncbi:hypothetical protein K438DRAFT_772188 [Mycena galopus ATCC 62051]|nr:hypothetical protein K438DRAFT_772188 [Mycena galopus ATCC 62051]